MSRSRGSLWRRLDRGRLLAMALWALPALSLLPLGVLWLWQQQVLVFWLAATAGTGLLAWGLDRWLTARSRRLIGHAADGPDPDWPPSADAAWQQVEALAAGIDPAEWPLDDANRWLELGRRTLETVARHYHPRAEQPLWELTVPHLLLIIERASRKLGHTVVAHVPFSHQLTIGRVLALNRWRTVAGRAWNLYRAGRMVLNPANAVLGEVWTALRDRAFGNAQQELQGWLLREYVLETGRYAIELYSGRLRLDEAPELPSAPDIVVTEQRAQAPVEPLRILVLGQTNAGKSSLVNALFDLGEAAADGRHALVDALPATGAVTPYRLTRAGLTAALVFDTPGLDGLDVDDEGLNEAIASADLVLWTVAAHRADRAVDRERLDALRHAFSLRPERRPPPVLVPLTHIDRLRPFAEWAPPYDLAHPDGEDAHAAKTRNILTALAAVAHDLAVPPADVVPVCLAPGRLYNVADTLWSAILARQTDADRARSLRCLASGRRAEDWKLLRRQLGNAGRYLASLPERWLKAD
ncbi:GTPase family protein [Plasticicumulans sp.]|uniref:GTPase family protein n=1 Tax=Plasticicumulans sp. TaxID=2307179 RepID=UPI00394C0E7E